MSPHLAHPPPSTTAPSWFSQEAAGALMRLELRELIPVLSGHIGVRGLFLRPCVAAPGELSGNMLQSVVVAGRVSDGEYAGQLRFGETELPFGNDVFGLICALHVLDARADPEPILAEMIRCLQPEGLLLIGNLARSSPWRWRWRRSGHLPPTSSHLQRLLQDAGVVVESVRRVGPVFGSASESAQTPAPSWLRAGQLWVARKRRIPVTPLRNAAPARRPVGAGAP